MKFINKKKRSAPRNPKIVQERPKIFSYSSARNVSEKPINRGEERPKRKTKAPIGLSKTINILIALFIISSILWLGMLEPNAQVKISGDKVYPREKNAYELKIDEILKESIFNRTKLTFSESKLEDEIRQEFPEINSINISIPFIRHRPVVEVTLAKPEAKLVTTDKTYILDSQGRALFEEFQASSSLDKEALITINDSSGHEIILGKPALTEAQINYINQIIGQTAARGVKPQSFALSESGTAVDVRFEGVSYFVKFSFYADARQSSGAFMALNEQFVSNGSKPQQYVDLRIPDKAFFK